MMLGALVAFAGCESKGPAEKAGESIDKGIQNAKDAVNPPGAGGKGRARPRQGPQTLSLRRDRWIDDYLRLVRPGWNKAARLSYPAPGDGWSRLRHRICLAGGGSRSALYQVGVIGWVLRGLGLVVRGGDPEGLPALGASARVGFVAAVPGDRLRLSPRGRGGRWSVAGLEGRLRPGPLFMGAIACLAYMFIDLERNEVETRPQGRP